MLSPTPLHRLALQPDQTGLHPVSYHPLPTLMYAPAWSSQWVAWQSKVSPATRPPTYSTQSAVLTKPPALESPPMPRVVCTVPTPCVTHTPSCRLRSASTTKTKSKQAPPAILEATPKLKPHPRTATAKTSLAKQALEEPEPSQLSQPAPARALLTMPLPAAHPRPQLVA